MVYFIQEKNQEKDKQKRPILVNRQQRQFFLRIHTSFLESQIFLQEQLCSR